MERRVSVMVSVSPGWSVDVGMVRFVVKVRCCRVCRCRGG